MTAFSEGCQINRGAEFIEEVRYICAAKLATWDVGPDVYTPSKGKMCPRNVYTPEEVGHGHVTVHVIKSYVRESHMKPFSLRVAA